GSDTQSCHESPVLSRHPHAAGAIHQTAPAATTTTISVGGASPRSGGGRRLGGGCAETLQSARDRKIGVGHHLITVMWEARRSCRAPCFYSRSRSRLRIRQPRSRTAFNVPAAINRRR